MEKIIKGGEEKSYGKKYNNMWRNRDIHSLRP